MTYPTHIAITIPDTGPPSRGRFFWLPGPFCDDPICPISVVCSGIENRLKARDKRSASGDGFAA